MLPPGRPYSVPVYDDLSREEALLSISPDHESILRMRREIRQVMWKYVSLQRDQQGLLEATRQLHNLRTSMLATGSTHQNNVLEWLETVNMLKVAELVIAAALQRRESRGSHSRLDYPVLNEQLTGLHYAFQPVLEEDHRKERYPGNAQGGRKGAPLLYYEGNGGPDHVHGGGARGGYLQWLIFISI